MICGIRLLSFRIDLNEKFAHVLSVPLQSLLGNYVSVYGLKAISTEKLWRRLTKIPSLRWCRIKKTGHYLFLSAPSGNPHSLLVQLLAFCACLNMMKYT